MYVDHLTTTKHPTAQANLTARLCHKVGLGNLALGALGNLAHDLHAINALFLNRLRQAYHLRDFFQHTVELVLKVIVVIDDTQMRMARPGLDYFLIKFTGDTQTFFIGLFVTSGIGGGGIILLCTVSVWAESCRDKALIARLIPNLMCQLLSIGQYIKH